MYNENESFSGRPNDLLTKNYSLCTPCTAKAFPSLVLGLITRLTQKWDLENWNKDTNLNFRNTSCISVLIVGVVCLWSLSIVQISYTVLCFFANSPQKSHVLSSIKTIIFILVINSSKCHALGPKGMLASGDVVSRLYHFWSRMRLPKGFRG